MTTVLLSVFEISVSVSFMVLAVILLTPILTKRYAAKWKYLIWIFLACRLLVPLNGADGHFMMDWLPQRDTWTVPKQQKEKSALDGRTLPYQRMVVEIPAQMAAPIKMQSASQPGKYNGRFTMLDILAFAWMAGSLVFLAVHIISYSHYRRRVKEKGERIKDTRILVQIDEIKHGLHIRRTVQAVAYPEAGSPMVIGFLKPVLVLPQEPDCAEELFFILKHELVHFKRGDVYLKLLFVVVNAVHWFNPVIWMMQKEAMIDMELSCDERVTQGASYDVRKAYTETLLSMLHKQCAQRTVLSTQFYGGTKIMKRRFKNILTKNKKKNGICILLCAVVLTISLGTLVGCSIAKEDSGKENANDMTSRKAAVVGSQAAKTLTFSKEGGQEKKQGKKQDKRQSQLVDSGGREKNGRSAGGQNYLKARDCQKIQNTAEGFAAAYFNGDVDAIRQFLAKGYDGEIETYDGAGTVNDLTVKGLSDADRKEVSNGRYVVSVEFRDSSYEDMFLYLTIGLIKQKSSWKVEFYGVEG